MKLLDVLNENELIVENGPLGTRLKYDYGYEPTTDLTQDTRGKQILLELYKGDIEVALNRDILIVIPLCVIVSLLPLISIFRRCNNYPDTGGFLD